MSATSRSDKDTDSKILAAIERLANANRAWLQSVATANGLTPMQVQIIEIVGAAPAEERKVSAIARELNVRQPTVTDAVNTLEGKGLVKRTADANDGRASVVELTAAGRRAEKKLDTTAPGLKSRLKKASNNEKAATANLLNALINQLIEDEVINAPAGWSAK